MEQKQLMTTARITGLWYLILAIAGMVGFLVYHPQLFVRADPQQTLDNLINQAAVARLRLVLELVIVVSQALAAVWFYKLFSGTNKWAATALCIWGTVNAVVILISAIAMNAAIDIAHATAYTIPEKKQLIALLTNLIANAWAVGGLFFGLWLMPMGSIIVRSKRMPVWLGRILILGGIGYLLQTFINAAGFEHTYLGMLVIPATVGELWVIGYLLIFGIRPEMAIEQKGEQ